MPVRPLSTAATPARMAAAQRSGVKEAGSYVEDMPSPSPRNDAPVQSAAVTLCGGLGQFGADDEELLVEVVGGDQRQRIDEVVAGADDQVRAPAPWPW